MSPQNVATVSSNTGCPKIGQGSGDAVVSPTRVLAYQIHHQLLNLLAKPRPASGPALFRAVKLLRDELAIAGQNCVRLSHAGDLLLGLRPSRFPISASCSSLHRSGHSRFQVRVF
jgi:hypothetical protein